MPVARYIADLLHDSISGASAGRERLIPIQRLNSVTSWSGRVCPPLQKSRKPRHVERMRNSSCTCLWECFASLRMTKYAI